MLRPPSIVPDGFDRDIYLVLDEYGGHLGRSWREISEERTDRATLIRDLREGQYSSPVRIVAFNLAKGWVRDLSEEIANELARSFEDDMPDWMIDFIAEHVR
jgi:hypothetical protein